MPFIAPVLAAVGTVVGAVGSFVAGLGAVGQAALGIGLSVAAGYVQREIAGKQGKTPGGVQFERQYGGAVPRQVACGLVGVSGHDCYVNTFGPSNYELQQVYAVSDYPCDGLSRVAINGKWVTLSATETSIRGFEVLSGDYAGLIFVKFFDGTQTSAFNVLTTYAHPSDRWTDDHIGAGVAHIVVSMTYHEERNSSFPDFFFEIRGARLYDWRKDSTAGGSGPHRWGVYATHEYTENPVVIEYNYRRGLSVNGDLFCGMGMAADDLPLGKWTPAANLCDETTDYGPRYRCSIMLDCTALHGENIASLQASCGAATVDAVEGSWPVVGHDQPVAVTITDDDLISTEPVRWRARRSMSELVNSVAGNFPSAAELWSMIGYETQTSEALVTLDRRTRDLTIDFPQVRIGDQAAALASIYFEENRYEATATLTLRPRFLVLEPGDWVRWNSARYGDRVYVVAERTLASLDAEGPRNITVSLEERDGAIYDGITAPVIDLPWPPGEPVYLAEVQSFSLLPVTLTGGDGRLLPGIRAAWGTIADVTVTSVEIQYYPTAQPEAVIFKVVPASQTVAILAEGVVANTAYRVRTRIRTSPARPTAWSTGATVTTASIIEDIEVYLADIKGDAYATLEQMRRDQVDTNLRMDMFVRDTSTGLGRQVVAVSAATAAGKANAAAIRSVQAGVSDLGAWAAITDGVLAEIQGAISGQAQAMSELSARVSVTETGLTAVSSALTSVSATVDNIGGSGLWKMEVRAGSGDVTARLAILMRASIGATWREVGTVWETGVTGGVPFSRIAQYAGQYVIVNPVDGSRLPVFVVDTELGQVIIGEALIKRLTTSNFTLTGLGSKLQITSNPARIKATS